MRNFSDSAITRRETRIHRFASCSKWCLKHLLIQVRLHVDAGYVFVWLATQITKFPQTGLTPDAIRGSNCGVFVGACFNEVDPALAEDATKTCLGELFAGSIAHYFDLHGPAFNIDTACASGSSALVQAITCLKYGLCDSAIVASANISLRLVYSPPVQFWDVLSFSSLFSFQHLQIQAGDGLPISHTHHAVTWGSLQGLGRKGKRNQLTWVCLPIYLYLSEICVLFFFRLMDTQNLKGL